MLPIIYFNHELIFKPSGNVIWLEWFPTNPYFIQWLIINHWGHLCGHTFAGIFSGCSCGVFFDVNFLASGLSGLLVALAEGYELANSYLIDNNFEKYAYAFITDATNRSS